MEEKQKNKLNELLKIVIIVGILVITFSVACYFFIAIPKKENVANEQYNQEKTDVCVKEVNEKYEPILSKIINEGSSVLTTDEFEYLLNYQVERWNDLKRECINKYGGII